MRKIDFPTLDEARRYAFRKQAIDLIKSGKRKGEVSLLIGVRAETISDWWKSYQYTGLKGLKARKKGAKSEDRKRLTSVQEQLIQKMIVDKMPEQLKLDFALWIRKAVKELGSTRIWC